MVSEIFHASGISNRLEIWLCCILSGCARMAKFIFAGLPNLLSEYCADIYAFDLFAFQVLSSCTLSQCWEIVVWSIPWFCLQDVVLQDWAKFVFHMYVSTSATQMCVQNSGSLYISVQIVWSEMLWIRSRQTDVFKSVYINCYAGVGGFTDCSRCHSWKEEKETWFTLAIFLF